MLKKFYFPSAAGHLMNADSFAGWGFLGHLLKYYPMILNHRSDFSVNKIFLPVEFLPAFFLAKMIFVFFKAQLISFIGLDFILFGDNNKYNPTVISYTQAIANCSFFI